MWHGQLAVLWKNPLVWFTHRASTLCRPFDVHSLSHSTCIFRPPRRPVAVPPSSFHCPFPVLSLHVHRIVVVPVVCRLCPSVVRLPSLDCLVVVSSLAPFLSLRCSVLVPSVSLRYPPQMFFVVPSVSFRCPFDMFSLSLHRPCAVPLLPLQRPFAVPSFSSVLYSSSLECAFDVHPSCV